MLKRVASGIGVGLLNLLVLAVFVSLPGRVDRVSGAETQRPISPTTKQGSIAALPNGNYQQCSQPEPKNLDGAGVCLIFKKTQQRIAGYYGYPHSDRFVCLEGTIHDDRVVGKAHILSWPGEEWTEMPQAPFRWDEEGHLTLQEGRSQPLVGQGKEPLTLITFEKAVLDVAGFYQYSHPKMKDPADLCQMPQAGSYPAQLD